MAYQVKPLGSGSTVRVCLWIDLTTHFSECRRSWLPIYMCDVALTRFGAILIYLWKCLSVHIPPTFPPWTFLLPQSPCYDGSRHTHKIYNRQDQLYYLHCSSGRMRGIITNRHTHRNMDRAIFYYLDHWREGNKMWGRILGNILGRLGLEQYRADYDMPKIKVIGQTVRPWECWLSILSGFRQWSFSMYYW